MSSLLAADIKIITKTYPQEVKPDRGEEIKIITKP